MKKKPAGQKSHRHLPSHAAMSCILSAPSSRAAPQSKTKDCWPPATVPAWSWAETYSLGHVAFCCIATGEFHFPSEKAADIAIQTVKEYQKSTRSKIEVIFNVFKDNDFQIYRKLLIAD